MSVSAMVMVTIMEHVRVARAKNLVNAVAAVASASRQESG